ncbi:class I SAM-dependent methyltransferase [Oceanivirga miroungae]|uniref:Type 12 methyltransferase n=1 Tax=Oceanivirga miroungae TaxID=1130046 RepID=A0A6I8MAX3_9FUSO|nr:class I SAM-dependent methyltransferase [Oceanivirga miroungae]VWL85894.1 type 12 methyltransferase [Oceanivirga miroungae]
MEDIKSSYDSVGYLSKAFYQTLPYAQKLNMKLFGFDTKKLENARVLEIGCSYGGNILTFAMANKNSYCVGIDLSGEQIKKGKELVDRLGVKNLELIEMDITNFDENLGMFDYIICHGVYSWVPKNVQDAILKVIKKHLNKNGSAVISYNTYPGWKSIEVIKDIMNFRTSYLDVDGMQKLPYGKGAMEFVKSAPYLKEVASRVDDIMNKDDYYLYHEYFEIFNEPMYLVDFSKKLEANGLSHVSDMNYSKSFPLISDAKLQENIENEANGDRIIKEQYYDYYFNRQFRISLITHSENIQNMNISNNVRKVDLDELHFRMRDSENKKFDTYDKLIKNFPNTLSTSELGKEDSVYRELLLSIYNDDSMIYTEKIDVNVFNDKKIRLKPVYRKYIEYFLEEENPIIMFATFDGHSIKTENKFEYKVMLMFDGINKKEDIYEEILKMEIDKEIEVNAENKEKAILEYINNVRTFLICNNFCEKVDD